MITVTKRSGIKEALDISKIQRYTSEAVKGLNNVSQSELELDAKLQFTDGISTENIQKTLIQTAVDKIDLDKPDWTFVAARLFLYDLYHRVGRATGAVKGESYSHLSHYFKIGEEQGRIIKDLSNKYDLEAMNDYIKPERDLQFTYIGIKTMYDRYLLKDKNKTPIELPQQMFMATAMFLAQNEKDRHYWAKQFYDVLSKFEAMAATPILSNSRTYRHQLSSCFIGSTPDNIEGIFDGFKEMAILSKYGGGLGWDWSQVRASNSFIDNHKNAAGGVIPFLKITNDLAIAVDQLGTRKGAIATYIEIWHQDIIDFLELKKNSGEERRRAHDLFPAVWINDLFMFRLANDDLWSLFDPYHAPKLSECYGETFKQTYIAYEMDHNIPRIQIRAKEIWKKVLTSYFETGTPFLGFKDTANHRNPNNHEGIIRSSNLCTEIFQNTSSNSYEIKIEFEDGSVKLYDEKDMVTVDSGTIKPANKISPLDYIDGKKVFINEKERTYGKTAICNLASINLAKTHTKEAIQRVVPVVTRMLDNVIDLNFYPVKKVKLNNLDTRSIGVGVMGEAQMLAEKNVTFGQQEHFELIDEIMESISYEVIQTSCSLAKERGAYKLFKGSKWSQGILPIDNANEIASELTTRPLSCDWDTLRKNVKQYGVRNGYLMAIAPTSTISILVGTSQTIEPIYKTKWLEDNLSGFINMTAPNVNIHNIQYYISAYDVKQENIIKAAAIRQKYLDQGQSLNLFIKANQYTGKQVSDFYVLAWRMGLKSTYYLRSESPKSKGAEYNIDRSQECEGCQ